MKIIITKLFILFGFSFMHSVQAHHTKEHTMLMEDPELVIAATQQGAGGPWVWLVWFCVACLFVFGIWQWHRK